MFITRKKYNRLTSRLDDLERVTSRHGDFLHRDYEALKQHKSKIDGLIKTVGEEEPTVLDSLMGHYFGRMFGESRVRVETKRLTLTQKVEQIMEHTGLFEKHTSASVKLAKKPEPKAKPETAKKAKR